jgi:archaemetzincin
MKREMSPKVKRRLILFFAGVSAGGVLAVFALVLPARHRMEGAALGGGVGRGDRSSPSGVGEDGFEKLGPPGPSDWRSHFHEPSQSFEDYVTHCANLKGPGRSTFYIQPLSTPPGRRNLTPGAHEQHEKAIALMRDYAEIYFGVPAKVLDPIPTFEETYDRSRGQCQSTEIIGLLAARLPDDALVYIGITEDDLYAEGLNFVFGEGSLERRTGVYSLRRYHTPDEALFTRRALKLMAHEVGHILSIHHCVTWRCVMQGANTLYEDDSHPMYLCPIDLRKLEWNCGFDRVERYRKLLEFYRRVGLKEDAAWVEERLAP